MTEYKHSFHFTKDKREAQEVQLYGPGWTTVE